MDIIKETIRQCLNESENNKSEVYKLYVDEGFDFNPDVVKKFIDFTLSFLGLNDENHNLKIILSVEKDKFMTYAFYDIKNKIAAVYCEGRAILDYLRSLAHELVHYKQDIRNEIPSEEVSEGNDGTNIENEANAVAGIIMRKFGRENKNLY